MVTSDFHMARSRRIFEVAAALAGEALWHDPDRRAPATAFASAASAAAARRHSS